MATKVSILLLYRRLFPMRNFVRILWAVGIFVAICNAVTIIVLIFQCVPVEATWHREIPARCVDLSAALTSFSAINVFTDIVILVLPIPLVWSLNTTVTRKIQLTGLFALGGL